MKRKNILQKGMAVLLSICMLAGAVPAYACEGVVEEIGQDSVVVEDDESAATEIQSTDMEEVFAPEAAAEKTTGLEDTDFLELYLANLAFKEGSNPVNNGVDPYLDSVKYYHEIGHPSSILMDDLNKNSIFKGMLVGYNILTFDPSMIVDKLTSQGEYDTAILLSMLNIALMDDRTVEAFNSRWAATQKQSMSWITEGLKRSYNKEIKGTTRIKDVDKEQLNTYFGKLLKDKYDMADGFGKGMEIFDIYVDTLTTVQELTNVITSYVCIYQMDSGIFDVLREMKEHTTDVNIRYALNKLIDSEESVLTGVFNGISDSGTIAFKQLYKNIVGSMWSSAALDSPVALIYLSQKSADAFCNLAVSTNAISEQYWKMDALCKIENALYDAHTVLGKKYVQDQTLENARRYNRSVDLWFGLYDTSCEYAKTYGDIVNQNMASWLFGDEGSYKKFIGDVERIQSYARSTYQSLRSENYYLIYLEEDYPELYKELSDMHAPKVIPVTGIKIDADTLEWGMEDSFLSISYTISPSNANNQRVQYLISDTSVLIYDRWGFIAKKPGDVKVTVATDDGGYSDSVVVHVVKGHGKNGGYLPPSPTGPAPTGPPSDAEVVGSGKCGDNVQWKFMNNGVLYIYGEGEMTSSPWLRYSDKISSLVIDDGLTCIYEHAFLRCTNLENVDLPDCLINIGDEAFRGCSSLKNIKVPKNVKKIGKRTFADCGNLTGISLSENVVSIGDETFQKCGSLKNVKIPQSVKEIGKRAFADCGSLTDISLSENIVSIGDETFRKCNSLKNVKIPQNVKEIGRCAFAECASLADISLSENTVSIGDEAFRNCSSLKNVKKYKNVQKIGKLAFADCTNLTKIDLSGNIESIDDEAFQKCSSLKNVIIPQNVKEIGEFVFSYCVSLTNVKIEKSIKNIRKGTFKGCSKLASVTISEGVECIDEGAFQECSSLKSIVLPNTLESIGNYTFLECVNIRSIIIPSNVQNMGIMALAGCSNLREVNISSKRIVMSNDIFLNCSKLEYAEITENSIMTKSGSQVFSGSSLKKVVILNSAQTIEEAAFEGCKELESVTIPKGVKTIKERAFSGCNNLKSIILPESLTFLGQYAFSYCTKLNSVTMPNTLTEIDTGAFQGCKNLKSITFPQSVKRINAFILNSCDSLQSITMKGNAPSVLSGLYELRFEYAKKCKIYVPKGAIGYDQSPWTDYKIVYGGEPSAVPNVKSVSLSADKYTYNGKVRKPAVTAIDSTDKKISAKNYTVTYAKGRRAVGQYKVTVKFKGGYQGTVTKNFTIVPKGTSLKKLKAGEQKLTVSWKKQATQTSGYQLQYAAGAKFKGAKTKLVSGSKKTSAALSKLEAKKKYYVRVRTYKTVKVNGKSTKLYSSWSKAKSVKTTGKKSVPKVKSVEFVSGPNRELYNVIDFGSATSAKRNWIPGVVIKVTYDNGYTETEDGIQEHWRPDPVTKYGDKYEFVWSGDKSAVTWDGEIKEEVPSVGTHSVTVTVGGKKAVLDNVIVKDLSELPAVIENSGTVDAVMTVFPSGWFRFKTGSDTEYTFSYEHSDSGVFSSLAVYTYDSAGMHFVTLSIGSTGTVSLEPNSEYYITKRPNIGVEYDASVGLSMIVTPGKNEI